MTAWLLGVFEAVKNGGKQKQIAVVGTDGIREAKRSVGAGEMRATVAEFPYDEGVLGVQVALRLLGCQAIPPWVVSPQAVITSDNVKDSPILPLPKVGSCPIQRKGPCRLHEWILLGSCFSS